MRRLSWPLSEHIHAAHATHAFLLCIPVFFLKKKSIKLLSNGLANGLCIFVNLTKSWDGLAYMQARDRLGIPSHALLPRALFPPAPPGFLFWILASQFCQTVGDKLFFSPPHIDLRVGKLYFLSNKKCKNRWSCSNYTDYDKFTRRIF
jgi:hypothetical protein